MADKNLKKAMEEIKIILERYDVGGSVVLATKSDIEYFYRLNPSWSIVSHDLKTGGVRVKALRKDYPNKKAQLTAITDSANMVLGMRQMSKTIHQHMAGVAEVFERNFDLDFKMGELEPHIEIEQSGSVN